MLGSSLKKSFPKYVKGSICLSELNLEVFSPDTVARPFHERVKVAIFQHMSHLKASVLEAPRPPGTRLGICKVLTFTRNLKITELHTN